MITLLMFLTCNPAGLMAEAWPHPITSAFPKRTIREFLFIEALQTRRPELCQLNSHGMQVKVGVFVCTVRYFISFQATLNLPGVHKSHVFTGFPRNRLHLMTSKNCHCAARRSAVSETHLNRAPYLLRLLRKGEDAALLSVFQAVERLLSVAKRYQLNKCCYHLK